jgi:hypothetical protein
MAGSARWRRRTSPLKVRPGEAASAATWRFSNTVMPENTSRRWNVRARPRAARSAGEVPVTSWPDRRTRPDDGGRSPHSASNSVVLPAPLGPISDVIEPAATSSEAPSTAVSPPKRTVISSATSTASV